MKKYSAIALMLVLSVSLLAGCRGNKNVPQTTTTAPVATQSPTVTTSPTVLPTTPDTGDSRETNDGMITDGTNDGTNGTGTTGMTNESTGNARNRIGY